MRFSLSRFGIASNPRFAFSSYVRAGRFAGLNNRIIGLAHDHAFRDRSAAHTRVVAALTCVNAQCPGLDSSGKRLMANQILTLGDGKDRPIPRKRISDAQVTEMVWRNIQCIRHRSPMLLFGRQLAEEINEFFKEEE